MTAEEFEAIVGHPPEQDDLERANCDKAGQIGHFGCGICEHGKPVFLCMTCFAQRNGAPKFKYRCDDDCRSARCPAALERIAAGWRNGRDKE